MSTYFCISYYCEPSRGDARFESKVKSWKWNGNVCPFPVCASVKRKKQTPFAFLGLLANVISREFIYFRCRNRISLTFRKHNIYYKKTFEDLWKCSFTLFTAVLSFGPWFSRRVQVKKYFCLAFSLKEIGRKQKRQWRE